MDIVKCIQKVPVRVTDERWLHIIEEHSELSGRYYEILETISDPDEVYAGSHSELLAARKLGTKKYLIAVYKIATPDDGFLITAFMTKNSRWFKKRKCIWRRKS